VAGWSGAAGAAVLPRPRVVAPAVRPEVNDDVVVCFGARAVVAPGDEALCLSGLA
jgi:hypothetical protein